MNRVVAALAVAFAMSPTSDGDPGGGCNWFCNSPNPPKAYPHPAPYHEISCVDVAQAYLRAFDAQQHDGALDRLALACKESWSTDLRECVTRSHTRHDLDACWTDWHEGARVARIANGDDVH